MYDPDSELSEDDLLHPWRAEPKLKAFLLQNIIILCIAASFYVRCFNDFVAFLSRVTIAGSVLHMYMCLGDNVILSGTVQVLSIIELIIYYATTEDLTLQEYLTSTRTAWTDRKG